MKNRHFAPMLSAALCAALLCGCTERIPDVPVTSDFGFVSSSSVVSSSPISSTTSLDFSASSTSSTTDSTTSTTSTTSSSTTSSSSSSESQQSSVVSVSSSSEPEPEYTYTTPLENYRAKWAYNHITSKQQEIYKRLYTAAENYDTSELEFSALKAVTDDLSRAYWAFDHDNPHFLWLGSGYQMRFSKTDGRRDVVSASILFGREPGSVPQTKFDSVANEVVSQAAEEPTDYDKLMFIHDWIVENTVYNNTGALYESEADGPVVYGEAVCEGYSKAFMYFAQSLEIECICVIGKANDEEHMWNMVNLYGSWYHVDVTWDDPKTSDGSNVLRHNYFLLSDSDIGETHEIEEVFTLPSAPNTYVE